MNLPARKDIKDFVLSKLKLYSHIPSLSGHEKDFLNFLVTDFDTKDTSAIWRKVYENDTPYYYYRIGAIENEETLPYFLVTHVDRVPNYNAKKGTPYIDTIESSNEFLSGQLDNIIGVAIARYLVELRVPIDILFTTKEEVVKSTLQLWEMCKFSGKVPITIDIDIFNEVEAFMNGLITLRFKDRNGYMLDSLVKKLQKVATINSIPFSFLDGEAIVETGFLSKLEDGKYKGAHVGIPLINYHSDVETTLWECVYNTIEILFNFFTKS